jgi:hypothetical protein
MEINENTGGEITLADAQKYVGAFRTKYPNEVKAFFIGSKNVEKILEQADCIGIRIYNGYDSGANRLNLVLVGVDDKGEDMTEGVIMDQLKPCPSHCDGTSALMNF